MNFFAKEIDIDQSAQIGYGQNKCKNYKSQLKHEFKINFLLLALKVNFEDYGFN